MIHQLHEVLHSPGMVVAGMAKHCAYIQLSRGTGVELALGEACTTLNSTALEICARLYDLPMPSDELLGELEQDVAGFLGTNYVCRCGVRWGEGFEAWDTGKFTEVRFPQLGQPYAVSVAARPRAVRVCRSRPGALVPHQLFVLTTRSPSAAHVLSILVRRLAECATEQMGPG